MNSQDRFNDLQRQGFMRPRARKSTTTSPVVACDDCLNWHTQGHHTASAETRAARRVARKAEKARRSMGG